MDVDYDIQDRSVVLHLPASKAALALGRAVTAAIRRAKPKKLPTVITFVLNFVKVLN